jgi:hypothetical protein
VTALAELASNPSRFYARAVLGASESPEGESEEPARSRTPGGAALGRLVHRRLARGAGASQDAGGPDGAHARVFLHSVRGREAAAAAASYAEIAFVLPAAHGRLDGTIDRLYRAQDGVWTIVDYKTDRTSSDRSLAAHAIERGYDMQLLLYGAAAAHILELAGTDAIRLVIFFTHPEIDGDREVVREMHAAALPGPEEIGRVLDAVERAARRDGAAAFVGTNAEREAFGFDAFARWTEHA